MKDKKFTYYPGCSAHGTSEEYEHTLNLVCKSLNIKIEEIPDWNCCGATSAHVMTENLALALPMRNLILAERLENSTMVIPCAACYSRMKETKIRLDEDFSLRTKINSTVDDGDYKGNVAVKSFLQYCFEDIGIEDIKEKVVKPLKDLKVACYYGCLLTRPKNIAQFDSPEYPISMDKIIESLGATAVEYPFKTECCGASFSISNTEIVLDLSSRILDVVKDCGADIIAVGCPLCQSNLDMRQKQIEEKMNRDYKIPVVYFTQLMALAFGYPKSELKLKKHMVNVEKVLASF